jgi:alpha-tubulin suppressor-like RCC1 family protein
MRYLGGFITASYNPLKVPNPPTIDTVTAGFEQVSVAFTAPTNVGGSAITSFTVLVTDSSSGATFSNTGVSSPIVVTGLTAGETYTAKVLAVNSYGPSAFSAPSGSFSPLTFSLYSWGLNASGELGLNDVINRSSPVQVGALTDWSQATGGNNFSAVVKTNGTLWSWGDNANGELGLDDVIDRSSPVQVGALTDWAQVSGGNEFCAAVKTNGTLWSWGNGDNGRLGHNNRNALSSPRQVGTLTDWSQVSTGTNFCAAVKTDGTLWSWGDNDGGQLGQGSRIARSSPVQVGALTDWSQVSAGTTHCVAIKTNSTLWSWGLNSNGQLGLNIARTIARSSPVQVGGADWAQVSGGNEFSAAIKTNGTLWTWGNNNSGQLGQNTATSLNRSSPVQVGALTDWSQVSAGQFFCAAIKTNGTLWSWGGGATGQNDSINRSSPVQVGALTSWSSVGQGSRRLHALAILN